jgi:hypothetical protein
MSESAESMYPIISIADLDYIVFHCCDTKDKRHLLKHHYSFYKQVPGAKKYKYRIDKAKGEPSLGNLRHIHIFTTKDKQVFAMNVDGTAHDGYHEVQIDEDLIEFLKNKGFTIPNNNIIPLVAFNHNIFKWPKSIRIHLYKYKLL